MKSLLRKSGAFTIPACLSLCLGVLCPSVDTIAAGPLTVVRVEEDLELVVATPDANSAAPQVTCVISPTRNVDSLHAAFELNHHSQPDFTPGGLQLQLWNDETLLKATAPVTESVLSDDNETIRWTQAMEVDTGTLVFEIIGGSSETWGDFGGGDALRASCATSITNLNGYTPTTSAKDSLSAPG